MIKSGEMRPEILRDSKLTFPYFCDPDWDRHSAHRLVNLRVRKEDPSSPNLDTLTEGYAI